MDSKQLHQFLQQKHRNIYQEAMLFEQNRKPVSSYLNLLAHPELPSVDLQLNKDSLEAANKDSFRVKNNVIDFRKKTSGSETDKQWEDLNGVLLNYQVYLTPYVLLNSLPVYSYIGEKTGLNRLTNATVVDVGAGTGQIYGTFFHHQESISYFLTDPNLRLLHDQFLRLYPKLSSYPLAHILCYAENLPFKNETADLVMSISSIDHFKDYKKFMTEAFRILKPGGQILIASHLDGEAETKAAAAPAEYFPTSVARTFKYKLFNRLALKFEHLARKYHNKKRGKVIDDHMHHFENTQVLESALEKTGFKVKQAEVFGHNFYVFAVKQS